jgi:hypothetical protein
VTLSIKALSGEELDAVAEEIRQRMFDMGSVEHPTYREELRKQLQAQVMVATDDPLCFTFTLHLIAQDIFQMLGRIRRTT